jgi:hypothetical protein
METLPRAEPAWYDKKEHGRQGTYGRITDALTGLTPGPTTTVAKKIRREFNPGGVHFEFKMLL